MRNSANQYLYNGAFFCDQSVTVGPGATSLHYNINVYDGSVYLFSCESGTPGATWVELAAGKIRCVARAATFASVLENGIWVTLTIKPE